MELPVIVQRIMFQKDNFCILTAGLDTFSSKYKIEMENTVKEAINPQYNSFTVKIGNLMSPISEIRGSQYVIVGDFVNDPKRGRQFVAEYYYMDLPTSEDGMEAFLMSLPNIKEVRSRSIVRKFGIAGTIDILDNEPRKLLEINGINEKRLETIMKEWAEKRYMCKLFHWLVSHDISVGIAEKAFKLWGNDSIVILEQDPYKLCELRGIGFLTADKIAHKIIKKVPLESRIVACMEFILNEQMMKDGNLCMPYSLIKKNALSYLLECDEGLGKHSNVEEYVATIAASLKNRREKFTVIKDTEEKPEQIYVYLFSIWIKEKYISDQIYSRKASNYTYNVDSAIDRVLSNTGKINLDESQKVAIKSAFKSAITVITGSAGTGKSLICRYICNIAKQANLDIRLMSPTGKAAQVLAEKTGMDAMTIHRSLKMKRGSDTPEEHIREHVVIIDEISMCGIDTMYSVMKALEGNDKARLILVGDKNQLPSVSPGNFLSDIISSGCAKVVMLDQVHRQTENSYISSIAKEIAHGKVSDIPENADDVTWHNIDANQFEGQISRFVDNYLGSGKSIEDLQIISPMKKGICGVFAINKMMQEKMAQKNNVVNSYISIGFSKYYLRDRVMQTENNYEKDVFNGDIGSVIDIGEKVLDPSISDKKSKFIKVQFMDRKVMYIDKDIDELNLAHCITVHKYQGSQAKNIIMIMANEAQVMMSKELVYTAMTRASEKLDIFGNFSMFRVAPTRSSIKKRYTNMSKIIKEHIEKRKIFKVLGE